MISTIINYIRSKVFICQNLLCAFFATSIFSLRWINCLPFSGYMPVLNNNDNLGFAGRYLIYAKESFSFPIGLIKGLSFPFQDANISRGCIPLFAILFKALSKFYAPFSEFYYFVLFELLSVFLVAYFTCLLLKSFKITSFWIRLLGTALVSLSGPLLHRSSSYYGLSFEVSYFPVYLACAYFYIRIYKHPNWKSFVSLVLIFSIAALICYYLLIGLFFLVFVCLCFNSFAAILNRNKLNRDRILFIAPAFVLGITISFIVLSILGNLGNLKIPPGSSVFNGRYSIGWGYGGGFGGGFHVADVLTVIIPPEDSESLSLCQRRGPNSYLTKLGFPLTSADLQDGQYEGFTYLGTITIGILFFLIIIKVLSLIKNYRINFIKLRLKLISNLIIVNELFSLPVIIGISTFMLYVISWGYIIHIGGIRFNNIGTPSLILGMLWPKFMFARSLGRLAIPFALYITIGAIICLGRYSYHYMYRSSRCRRVLFISIIVFLVLVHIYEIKGYLQPPEVTYGNDIVNVFGREDRILIKELLKNKRALMVVPAFSHNLNWGKICYSLAFHSNIPISGTTLGFGEPPEHRRQYDLDIDYILTGRVKEIVNKYGEVAIAAPSDIAEKILSKTDTPLKYHKLRNQDVTILTLDM